MLNRRDLLRGMAAAALLVPLGGRVVLMASTARAATPFTQPLRIPRVLRPDVRAEGDHYTLTMRAGEVEMLPGVSTPVWGYDGEFPGPTIVATRGRPVIVRQVNALDVPTAVHLHGGHVPPDMDGHALDLIPPGGERVYRYPNDQAGATLWYHDHAMHTTGRNIHNGLFGTYLVRDPAEDALGLPTGDRDLPLLLADRSFDADGRMVYPEHAHDGFLGDTPLVNGVAQPFHTVAAARYRLRFVNASNARRYSLSLRAESGRALTFTQIASDGGLLAAPVRRSSIELSPAERIEVVVDFGELDAGDRVVLANKATGAMTELARFDVGAAGPDASRVPATLATIPALTGATTTREVFLSQEGGVWKLQGHGFDADIVDFTPRLGAVEEWRFHNPTAVAHPMHVHLVQFQILDRDGRAPEPWERGWKDTVFVNAAERVRVIARFDGWSGTYIYHCHNLEHEDHDMMSQFRVLDVPRVAGADRMATAAAVSRRAFPDGAAVAVVATAGAFPDALAGGPAAAALGGPVLLTAGETLPAATAAELRRLAPERILVLGGPRAVPAAVERELRDHAATVTRLAGESRFATAAAVSREAFRPGVDTVYVATGADFPDALAGGAAAAADGVPLLLVDRHGVPEATATELRRLAPRRMVVLGGVHAVSEATRAALADLARDGAVRLAGDSRFATAAAVCADRWTAYPVPTVYVATGAGFADALAGVPAAAREDAPLLLVERDRLPEATAAQLRRLQPTRIVILGGPSAVSEAVADQLATFLRS